MDDPTQRIRDQLTEDEWTYVNAIVQEVKAQITPGCEFNNEIEKIHATYAGRLMLQQKVTQTDLLNNQREMAGVLVSLGAAIAASIMALQSRPEKDEEETRQ